MDFNLHAYHGCKRLHGDAKRLHGGGQGGGETKKQKTLPQTPGSSTLGTQDQWRSVAAASVAPGSPGMSPSTCPDWDMSHVPLSFGSFADQELVAEPRSGSSPRTKKVERVAALLRQAQGLNEWAQDIHPHKILTQGVEIENDGSEPKRSLNQNCLDPKQLEFQSLQPNIA